MSDEDQAATELLEKAQKAFADCLAMGFQNGLPVLRCENFPPFMALAEFSVTLNTNPINGLLHEEIVGLAKVASDNGGKLWLDGRKNGDLSIVWAG